MTRTIQWPLGQPLDRIILEDLKELLDSGGMMVYPTNTLYGIGASIFSREGIENVRLAKGRPSKTPFLIMADEQQVRELCQVTPMGETFLQRRPMQVTAVLRAGENAPPGMVHQGTLAVRLPCSELTASLVGFAGPIISTSANVHGRKPPGTCREAAGQLGDSVGIYIDSGPAAGEPTTLVDFTGVKPRIIRQGVLSPAGVDEIYG